MTSTEHKCVILVTGANRGIGFLIIKKLIEDHVNNDKIILLGSRNFERGYDALLKLGSPQNVRVLQLDMSSKQSIINAMDEIRQQYNNDLDVVINNAAIMTTEISANAARKSFETNYYGIKMLNECIIPMMRQNGRIINVSSRVGTIVLQEASSTLQEKYTSVTLTTDQLDHLVEEFISSIKTETVAYLGYNLKSQYLIYGVTKAALNSLTQIEARQYGDTKNLLFISVTPGLCATEMTCNIPNARSAVLGADSILYTVNACREKLENGAFYRDGEKLPLIHE